VGREDALILHVSGPSDLEPFLQQFPGRVAMYFHNITPPTFFRPGSGGWAETRRGRAQLPRLAARADVWLAPSAFNLATLQQCVHRPRPAMIVPPPIDPARERVQPGDERLLSALRATRETNFLVVGRLVANKRQDLAMEVFEEYHTRIDRRSRLHLIGDPGTDAAYARSLARRREGLRSAGAIELTGKVSDAGLQAYYRAADVFLCLSEHEGLCVPPLVAMAHDVPVLARAAAALPETLGEGAVLLHDVDPGRIAELVHLILEDPELRAQLVSAGKRALTRYAPAAVARQLGNAIELLRGGETAARVA
jgi:glycosyltransferase involved in cell wall biosynthesis